METTFTVGCIYPWTLALKTCFQLTSNVYVSGVKLWSFPTQTRACVISNVYISGVKLWNFSAQTRSSLDRVSALVVHCHRSLENMRKTRHVTEYSTAKTVEYPRIFPNFENCARCEKDLKDDEDNSLHLGRKYARIFVLGHYLFLVAHSFPRATLSENWSLLGTDNVSGQIS